MADGAKRSPRQASILARPAWVRLAAALAGLAMFWLTVAWAVSLP